MASSEFRFQTRLKKTTELSWARVNKGICDRAMRDTVR